MESLTKKSSRTRCSGVAMVEFAVLLLFLVPTFIIYWDAMMEQLATARHWSVANQLSLSVKSSALTATVASTTAGLEGVKLAKVGSTGNCGELVGVKNVGGNCNGLLAQLNSLGNSILDNAGTGSKLVDHNVGARLVFFDICTDESMPGCSGRLGQAFAASTAGSGPDYATECVTPTPEAKDFFTYPGKNVCTGITTPNTCFGDPSSSTYQAIRAKFDQYVQDQITTITSTPAGSPSFGTKIVDVPEVDLDPSDDDDPSSLALISALNVYSSIKPVVFLAICSDPPTFHTKLPTVTFLTFFFDKEVGF